MKIRKLGDLATDVLRGYSRRAEKVSGRVTPTFRTSGFTAPQLTKLAAAVVASGRTYWDIGRLRGL